MEYYERIFDQFRTAIDRIRGRDERPRFFAALRVLGEAARKKSHEDTQP